MTIQKSLDNVTVISCKLSLSKLKLQTKCFLGFNIQTFKSQTLIYWFASANGKYLFNFQVIVFSLAIQFYKHFPFEFKQILVFLFDVQYPTLSISAN